MAYQKSQPIDIGATLAGRYELIKIIGQGGMGCVFMARHKQVGRLYAVKVLWRTEEEDERTCKRFLQEAKIAGSLSHVNLTSVYDYGETEEGYPFLVMDFVDGVSLAQLLGRPDRIDVRRAVGIFIQICSGLVYAHEKGLVHRDLKPSNIMLVEQEGVELVKIVDFGIAKVVATSGETIQELTGSGEIFGSPFYASPEQCMGHKVDARSDVYSLGCLMFETLTGRKPIEGENPIQTIIKHIQQPPPSFSDVNPQHDVPDPIERIVLKCMAKEPENRYQSVAEVSAALSGWLESEPASTVAGAGDKKRAISPVLLMVPAAIVIAGIALAFYLRGTADHPRQPQTLSKVAAPLPLNAPSTAPATASVPPPVRPPGAERKSPVERKPHQAPGAVSQQTQPNLSKAKKAVEAAKTGAASSRVLEKPKKKTVSLAMATQLSLHKAQQRLAHLQSINVPKTKQEINRITGSSIGWNIDWSSFGNNPAALETFEYTGLDEIRDAMSEVAQVHHGQELKSAITEIRIRNVRELYERHVVLKSGVLTIYGAWGQGIKGSPTSLEIRLVVAAGM